MKKLLILLVSIFLISFIFALEFTPDGNINLQNLYNITNVPYYNGTTINITGLYYGNASQMDGILTGTEANLNVNSSNYWDDLNTSADITGLIDSQIADTLTIGSGSAIDKGALTNLGTLSFDWVDSEIADTLTIDVSSSVVWAALNTYPSTCTSSQYISAFGDTLTCAAISIAISQITDIANANVNRSSFWDNLNSPSDINAADITDDNTYLQVVGDTGTGNFIFNQNLTVDTNTLFVNGNTNRVGIGTTTPQNILNVVGDGNFTSNLDVSGKIIQGSTDYGAYEIQTTGQIYANDYIVANGGVAVGTPVDPGQGNLIVQNSAEIGGNLNMSGNDIINVGNIFGNSDYLSIGDAGTTNRGLASDDDLLITGELEVNGISYFDGTINLYGTTNVWNNMKFLDERELIMGDSSDVQMHWDTGSAVDAFHIQIANSRNMILTSNLESDHDHAAQTNPTLYIQSAINPDTDNTQWISFTHDQTDGVISTGTGNLILNSAVNITCFDSTCTWYTNATDSCMYWPSGGKDCGAA